MIIITDQPIDLAPLIEKIDKREAGSVVFHLGVVKPNLAGRQSLGITFTAQANLEEEMKRIEADLRARFKLEDVLLARRMGELKPGDSILLAAVSARDRESAFAACREAVERFKTMSAISKVERFAE